MLYLILINMFIIHIIQQIIRLNKILSISQVMRVNPFGPSLQSRYPDYANYSSQLKYQKQIFKPTGLVSVNNNPLSVCSWSSINSPMLTKSPYHSWAHKYSKHSQDSSHHRGNIENPFYRSNLLYRDDMQQSAYSKSYYTIHDAKDSKKYSSSISNFSKKFSDDENNNGNKQFRSNITEYGNKDKQYRQQDYQSSYNRNDDNRDTNYQRGQYDRYNTEGSNFGGDGRNNNDRQQSSRMQENFSKNQPQEQLTKYGSGIWNKNKSKKESIIQDNPVYARNLQDQNQMIFNVQPSGIFAPGKSKQNRSKEINDQKDENKRNQTKNTQGGNASEQNQNNKQSVDSPKFMIEGDSFSNGSPGLPLENNRQGEEDIPDCIVNRGKKYYHVLLKVDD